MKLHFSIGGNESLNIKYFSYLVFFKMVSWKEKNISASTNEHLWARMLLGLHYVPSTVVKLRDTMAGLADTPSFPFPPTTRWSPFRL